MTPGAREPLLVGIDIGTTAAKGVAVTADGTVVAQARRTHAVLRPAPGHVEHDAEATWWGGLVALTHDLLAQLGDPHRIAAVGVTTCGPCLVPVDEAGRPLRHGILYGVDTRGVPLIPALRAGDDARPASGLPLSSQSIGPKIAWVLAHEPAVASRTARWHTATSFLVERLTGVAAIDRHQAAYFGPLFGPEGERWDPDGLMRVPVGGQLPAIRWPSELAGQVTASAAAATALPVGVPVVIGTSDGPTATLAVGADQPGVVALSHGTTTTVSTLGPHTAAAPVAGHGLWWTPGLASGRPFVGGATSASGALLDWLTGVIGPGADAGEAVIDAWWREAAAAPPGANGLLVIPTVAGERTPVDDPAARGTIVGLTLAHTRGDLLRATVEGIAIELAGLLDAVAAVGLPIDAIRVTGGGARRALLQRVVADVTGWPQHVLTDAPGPSAGAARLAGEAIGAVEPGAPWHRSIRTVDPDPAVRGRYDELIGLARRVAADVRPMHHALAAMTGEAPAPADAVGSGPGTT